MSIGGGGFGGGGLPYPDEVLQLWGGKIQEQPVEVPSAPKVVSDDGTGLHEYAIVAVGPQGNRSAASPIAKAKGLAALEWDSAAGADAYVIIRDRKEVAGPLRVEGSRKHWSETPKK